MNELKLLSELVYVRARLAGATHVRAQRFTRDHNRDLIDERARLRRRSLRVARSATGDPYFVFEKVRPR